jgi:hypothetical protein
MAFYEKALKMREEEEEKEKRINEINRNSHVEQFDLFFSNFSFPRTS